MTEKSCAKNLLEDELRIKLENDQSKENIFLVAGAGSGKTTFCVNNITSQIESGVSIEKIAVITFTKKAAAEIRDRVYKNLLKFKDNSKSIKLALENFDQFKISTIHSFCYKILSENAFYLGLPVDITLLSDDEEIERIDKFYQDYIIKNKKSYLFFNPFSVTKSNKVIYNTYKNLVMLGEYKKISKPKILEIKNNDLILENFLENLKQKIIELNDEVKRYSIESKVKYNTKFSNIENINSLKVDSPSFLSLAINLCQFKKDTKSIITSKGQGKVFLTDNPTYFDEIENIIYLYKLSYINYIFDEAIELRNAYFVYLKTPNQINKISNNQILELTYTLMNYDNVDLNKIIKNAYSVIYLDESQDTDSLQMSIIKRLSCVNEEEEINHKLVIVGDPKQSIYSFRGADLNVFNNMIKENEKYLYKYNYNFRSNEKIIEFVNNNFKDKFIKSLGYYDEMISKCRKYQGKQKIVEGIYHAYTNDKEQINTVISLIKTLVLEKHFIFDAKNDSVKRITYSDFLVIIKNNDINNNVIDEFKKQGIKVIASTSISQEENRYLKEIKTLFMYSIDDSKKNAFLAGQILLKDVVNSKNIGKMKELLYEFKNKVSTLTTYGKLNYIFKSYQYLLFENVDKDELYSIQSNLNNNFEKLLSYGILTNEKIIEKLDYLINSTIDSDIILERNFDAVAIMNMHKTKGLEANIVIILSDSNDELKNSATLLRNDEVILTGIVGERGRTYLVPISSNEKLYEEINEEQKKEKERLDYVVLTRAKQAIFYVGKVENWLYKYFIDTIDIEEEFNLIKLEEKKDSKKIKDNIFIESKDYLDYKNLNQDLIISICPSDLENVNKSIASDFKIFKTTNLLSGATFGNVTHKALELLINDYIQNKDLDDLNIYAIEAINYFLDDIKEEQVNDVYLYQNEVYNTLKLFMNSQYFSMIKNSSKVETEFPFSIHVKLKEIESFSKELKEKIMSLNQDIKLYNDTLIWINGKADLVLFNKNKEIIIIDYKTDLKETFSSIEAYQKYLHERYDLQQELYAFVLAKLFDKKSKDIKRKLYFYR